MDFCIISLGVVDVPLQYVVRFSNISLYDGEKHSCIRYFGSGQFTWKLNSLAAFQIDLASSGVAIEKLISAVLQLSSVPQLGNFEFYAVRTYDYNKRYFEECRFMFMDGDVRTGPIYWAMTGASSASNTKTPNLASLLSPYLSDKGDKWTKQVILVMKYLTRETVTVANLRVKAIFEYVDHAPGR